MLYYENKAKKAGFDFIIGVDESGRGPLAGPVVAGATLLKKRHFKNRIDDSKKLNARQRLKAFSEICEHSSASVGVGIVSEAVIDELNILEATRLAMERAIINLISKSFSKKQLKKGRFSDKIYVLVDGNDASFNLPYKYKTIISGDSKSLSIASASIVAKVIRDKIMSVYDRLYPQYGFRIHKGYPTKKHREALRIHGPSIAHRKTFGPVNVLS